MHYLMCCLSFIWTGHFYCSGNIYIFLLFYLYLSLRVCINSKNDCFLMFGQCKNQERLKWKFSRSPRITLLRHTERLTKVRASRAFMQVAVVHGSTHLHFGHNRFLRNLEPFYTRGHWQRGCMLFLASALELTVQMSSLSSSDSVKL